MANYYTFNSLNSVGAHYGLDTVNGGKKSVTKDYILYRIRNIMGTRSEPYLGDECGYTYTDNIYSALNQYYDMGKNSIYKECMYRIFYNMNGKQLRDEQLCYSYPATGGFQRGSNFHRYTLGNDYKDKLPGTYCVSGYARGAGFWGPGVVNGGKTITYLGGNGIQEWRSYNAMSYGHQADGIRLCLLIDNY